MRGNLSIECNDEGAEFVETRVDSQLSDVMDKPDPGLLTQLVPSDRVLSEEVPLLLVQVNFFQCGGMAIGVSLSHKVADASTIINFLSCWASKTAKHTGSDTMLVSQFVAPPRVPPHNSLASLPQASAQQSLPAEKISISRLVFQGPKLSALKEKVSCPTVPNPTRVEAVLALIWKCAAEASRSTKSVLFQAVNLRKMLSLEENTPGNFSWSYAAKCEEIHKTELHNLVALIRNGVDEFKSSGDTRIGWEGMNGHVEEYLKMRRNGEVDIYMPTSWCRFRFYEVDFGWGKPSWVCVPNIRGKNSLVLMDTRDGYGIEHHMPYFHTNQELVEFASFSPSALD